MCFCVPGYSDSVGYSHQHQVNSVAGAREKVIFIHLQENGLTCIYRCWSVDFNLVDTKLIASGSDDAR